MFRSLRVQILALTFIPLIALAISSTFLTYQGLEEFGIKLENTTEHAMIEAEKQRLKSVIEAAKNMLSPYLAMPGQQGREEGIKVLKNFLYDDGNGYVFAYDYQGTRLLLGKSDSGIGNNYINLEDKNKKKLIQEMIKIGRGNGADYYTYYFPKPNSTVASPKYSYVIGID